MVRGCAFALILLCWTVPLGAQPDDTVDFDIPAQRLSDALVAFALQADISLGQTGIDLRPFRSREVKGTYSIREGMTRLLAGSGLRFSFVDDETIRILPAPEAREEQPVDTGPMDEGDLTGAISNITVTATKRTSRLQSLPVSIGIVATDKLNDFGIHDMNALAPRLAGVTVTNLGPGRNKIFVRGLSDGTFVDRSQSTVGIYLDETPITFSDTNPDLRLVDVDRVEVLRGPQGTLYGAGSIGGTYRIVTRKPDLDDLSASLSLFGATTENGGLSGAAEGMINIPITRDRFALRFAGYYEREAGFIDDVALGFEDVNNAKIYGGRAAARYRASDRWLIDVSANYQAIRLDDTQYFFGELGPFNRENFLQEPYRDNFRHVNATLRGELDWAELVSATSFVDRTVTSQNDATLVVPLLTGLDEAPSPFNSRNRIQTFSHETRLLSPGSRRWDWLIGAFFLFRDENLSTMITVPGAGQAFADQGFPTDQIFTESRDDRVSQLALFGETTYFVTPKIGMTAGIRLFRSAAKTSSLTDGIANDGQSLVDGINNRFGVTPKFVLSLKPTERLLVFAQASQGFRVGGININTPIDALIAIDPVEFEENLDRFDSDRLWNFELGVKSSWLGGRIVFNGSLFHVIWTNIQTDQLLPSGLTFVANAGKARSTGYEIELGIRPIDALEITATMFRSDPRLVENNDFLGAEAGDRLPGIAGLSGGVAAAYSFSLFGLDGLLAFDYAYIGDSSLTFAEENSPELGRYHVGNLRLRVGRESWRVGLFVENLWNEVANTFPFGNPFSLEFEDQVAPLRPRTIGAYVTLDY